MGARRRRDRRTTTERGYGGDHQKKRAEWLWRVNTGSEHCRRCGLWIPPGGRGRCPKCGRDHGNWDLGHSDADRSQYTGPEHMCCNRATAGRRKRKLGRLLTSRDW